METPLNASSTTFGNLMAGSRFAVPQFQRQYAWDKEDVAEFWSDLRRALEQDFYFLGLIILTGTGKEKVVVDGQQRLLTLTLLASALYHEGIAADRRAMAERLQSTFLRSINFDSDEELPRIRLSGEQDSRTLKDILEHSDRELGSGSTSDDTVSDQLLSAYRLISTNLRDDLQSDPFKRLGLWAEFLTDRLYLANFVHPDPASAYQVFEVVNTRGKELTTADLLKSYVLSQTKDTKRQERYEEWQTIAGQFPSDNPLLFVQFIRHAVTVRQGHVPPKDLYDALIGSGGSARGQLPVPELMDLLTKSLPLYLQMIDPTTDGEADSEQLGIFSAFSRLGVISVRPMLLAIAETDRPNDGMRELLKLVVRRVVVGNLGTGNVERRLGQAAQKIYDDRSWPDALEALSDLSPERDSFETQLHRRSLNKNVLAFLRQSIVQGTVTPSLKGFLHLIMPRPSSLPYFSEDWPQFPEEQASYWASTIGNSLLVRDERRPQGTSTWEGFVEALLPLAVDNEWTDRIRQVSLWDEDAVNSMGRELAKAAASVWYD